MRAWWAGHAGRQRRGGPRAHGVAKAQAQPAANAWPAATDAQPPAESDSHSDSHPHSFPHSDSDPDPNSYPHSYSDPYSHSHSGTGGYRAGHGCNRHGENCSGGWKLLVVGTSGNDTITISQTPTAITMTSGGVVKNFAGTFVSVAIYGFDGNDTIRTTNTVTAAVSIAEGNGNDTIFNAARVPGRSRWAAAPTWW